MGRWNVCAFALRLACDKLEELEARDGAAVAPVLSTALTCRLRLGIQRASAFAAELVRSRMAIAMFVPQRREWLTACFPIDPILAWAANKCCARASTAQMLEDLERMTKSALIDRGPGGGLITRSCSCERTMKFWTVSGGRRCC
jgi:hypothetical protein